MWLVSLFLVLALLALASTVVNAVLAARATTKAQKLRHTLLAAFSGGAAAVFALVGSLFRRKPRLRLAAPAVARGGQNAAMLAAVMST